MLHASQLHCLRAMLLAVSLQELIVCHVPSAGAFCPQHLTCIEMLLGRGQQHSKHDFKVCACCRPHKNPSACHASSLEVLAVCDVLSGSASCSQHLTPSELLHGRGQLYSTPCQQQCMHGQLKAPLLQQSAHCAAGCVHREPVA